MITARGLVQTFHTKQGRQKSEVRAVDGVDLDIAEGEVVGFLGPNGAGKTTTLRMLTTLLRPTAGTATVAGYDVVRESEQVRRSIGYVSQAGSTFSGARAGDEVVDHGMLYGVSRKAAQARGHELFEQLQLDGLWERMPKNMSGGQKRRLDIVMGLVHDPTLVFLDEPTTGLDPQARANLWEHIAALRAERGATVFLTTHYLDEADALSTASSSSTGAASSPPTPRTTSRPRSRATSSTSRSRIPTTSRSSRSGSPRWASTSRPTSATSGRGSPGPARRCRDCCATSPPRTSRWRRSRSRDRLSTTSS